MRVVFACGGLVLAVGGFGCGGLAATTGAGGAAGAAGQGGAAGMGAAGAAGSSGGAGGGEAGGGGGGGAGGHGGTGGAGAAGGSAGAGGATPCGDPASCEAYDNRPDGHLSAEIACLAPDTATANAAFTLSVYGHHLATGATDNAIVTVGGVPLNGVPASPCHLTVSVPASAIPSPGQVPVVVSPGGWTLASPAVQLTVR